MSYQVQFTRQAFDDVSRLDTPIVRRVIEKIQWLSEHVDHMQPERLTGPFAHLFKLRIGDWRVLYETDPVQRLITIHAVGHRSRVYKL
ncbi:type II toxin-antitoxin system RelE/ParE family toxin [Candidatus Methylomirabilis sp.]|uniref:type II toxin-antitoxin system RelE family toxin n=1 Tax=Candidatus Methylomirabilis sp. TaxID=2032687 RepID=UPI0030766592